MKLSYTATPLVYRNSGFATTLATSKFISVNSSTPTTAQSVGTWDAHNGTKLVITLTSEEVTAIRPPHHHAPSHAIYDLQGRKLTAPPHGIYIKDGSKYATQ